MNLTKLFQLQKSLNYDIQQKYNLNVDSLIRKKILALQSGIGTLADKTKCFNYWSTDEPCTKEQLIEQFTDCLDSILSIGIDKEFYDIDVELVQTDSDIIDQFLNLYIDINDLVITSSKDHYVTLFEDFITLGDSLGFDLNEIENQYIKKNTLNHARQNKGY